jgi:hypothetical protein
MLPTSSTSGRKLASTSAGWVSIEMVRFDMSGFQRDGAYSTGS